MGLYLFHPIAGAVAGTLVDEGEGLVGEGAAELLEGGRGVVVAVAGAEQAAHLLKGPETATLGIAGLSEGGCNHLHKVCRLLKTAVLLHQHSYLFVVEPITLSLVELLHQLGIELAMVEVVFEVDVASALHTDEPSAARGVHQWLHLVGGADERGVALILSDGLAVGWAELHVACREQVFQDDMLAGGGLVELVDVDQSKLRESEVQVGFLLEVDLLVVVHPQFRGHENAAETGLAAALTTY